MLKQQFIEKKLKMFDKYFEKYIEKEWHGIYEDSVLKIMPERIKNWIDSALSECWDMAGEELIDKVDLEIEAWMGANQNLDREFTTHEMMKHLRNTALTSQKEDKD